MPPANYVATRLSYLMVASKEPDQNSTSPSIENLEVCTDTSVQTKHEHCKDSDQDAGGLDGVLCPKRAKDFPSFTKLPAEIQDMIWRFALPGPRMIQVKGEVTESSRENGLHVKFFTPQRVTVNSKPDSRTRWHAVDASKALRSLLLSCHQSKEIVEKSYKNKLPSWEESRIHFDCTRDIILIQNFAELMDDMKIVEAFEDNYSPEPCFESIQMLGVPRPCMAEEMPMGRYNIYAQEFICFKSLRTLFAVSRAADNMLEREEEQELAADRMRSRWEIKGLYKKAE